MLFEFKKLPIHQKPSISVCYLLGISVLFFKEFSSFSMIIKVYLHVGAQCSDTPGIVKGLFCSWSASRYMWKEMYNVTVVVSGGGGWKSINPSWMKLRGCYPPWIFIKSFLQRLLTWNRSSMITDSLVIFFYFEQKILFYIIIR